MRHRRRTQRFNRKLNHRRAMFRNLMVSLVEHGRIRTTVEKAKELKRHIERAVTKAKDGDLAAFRLLLSRIANEGAVRKLIKEVSPKFKDRKGGYTRLIKLGKRPGDMAEMAFIEWVDYDFKKQDSASPVEAKAAKKGKADTDATKKASDLDKSKKAKAAKQAFRQHRKVVRKIQSKSRQESRASR